MYEIDSNVPMPKSIANNNHNGKKYPFTSMKVGDSFKVLTEKDRGRAMCAANAHSCTRSGQGHRFRSAKVNGGWRIWRIA